MQKNELIVPVSFYQEVSPACLTIFLISFTFRIYANTDRRASVIVCVAFPIQWKHAVTIIMTIVSRKHWRREGNFPNVTTVTIIEKLNGNTDRRQSVLIADYHFVEMQSC